MREIEPLYYDVKEFCEAARIGQRTFYNLKRAGKGPTVTKIGDRNLISIEDAKRWREKRSALSRMAAMEAADISTQPNGVAAPISNTPGTERTRGHRPAQAGR